MSNNSRPVSAQEFARLQSLGRQMVESMRHDESAPTGLDEHWTAITRTAYDACQASWGGVTVDAHTGKVIDRSDGYALSVRAPGQASVECPQDATQTALQCALGRARWQFAGILTLPNACLGVFHDDDKGTIDIDPVVIVETLDAVDAIGAATGAIGGAYSFADGNGYWPPHIATSTEETAA